MCVHTLWKNQLTATNRRSMTVKNLPFHYKPSHLLMLHEIFKLVIHRILGHILFQQPPSSIIKIVTSERWHRLLLVNIAVLEFIIHRFSHTRFPKKLFWWKIFVMMNHCYICRSILIDRPNFIKWSSPVGILPPPTLCLHTVWRLGIIPIVLQF